MKASAVLNDKDVWAMRRAISNTNQIQSSLPNGKIDFDLICCGHWRPIARLVCWKQNNKAMVGLRRQFNNKLFFFMKRKVKLLIEERQPRSTTNQLTNEIKLFNFMELMVCCPIRQKKSINQSINQINLINSAKTADWLLMIDDCWWFRWRWPPSARSTSIYSFHSQIEAFSWAAKLFNSFFISLNCPFSKSNSKRNKENWVSGGKKSNSSIPSIIDFIIIPLSFHEIPSIIEVLSLFDSFNYCYNTFIFFLSIPQSEMKTNQIKESLLFFCWIWLNGM